jgi:hypothetical protein
MSSCDSMDLFDEFLLYERVLNNQGYAVNIIKINSIDIQKPKKGGRNKRKTRKTKK